MPNLRDGRWRCIYLFVLTAFTLLAITPTAALAGPIVQILQPEQGEVVSGVIWIDVSYETSSDDPINRVEIYIDGEVARKWNLASPKKKGTSSFSWDFSLAAATNHTISAKAFDTSGASGSATITVTVKRAEASRSSRGDQEADRIPPVINIYYPSQGAKLSGLTEIRAEARDNVGVQQVYFYIDGRLHKMIYNSPPFYDQWDTAKTSDGKHVLEAVAVDASNNEARSAQVTVFVENHAMTRMSSAAEGGETSGVQPQSATSKTTPTEQSGRITGPGPQIHTTSPATTVAPAGQSKTARGHAADIEAPPVPQKPPKTSSTDARMADVSEGSSAEGETPSPSRTATLPAVDTGKMVTQRLSRPGKTLKASETSALRKGGLSVVGPGSPADAGVGDEQGTEGTDGVDVATRRVSDAAATPDVSETRVAGQRISRPQTIEPMPSVASAAATSDAVVPTYHAMNRLHPTTEFGAVAMPQRVTAPGQVEAGPHIARTGQTTTVAARTDNSSVFSARADQDKMPQRTTTPGGDGTGTMLTMLPRTDEGPATQALRSNVAALGRAIAEAPVEDIAVMFDGDMLTLRTAPEAVGDVPTGPLREMFEHSDGILYWFPVTKEVRAVSPTTDLHLTIGHDQIGVNGEQNKVTVAPYIKRGRTMVPLQFIANTLDVTITFDPGSKRLVVETNEF